MIFTRVQSYRCRADSEGLDPPGFKLRAASGFEAADFFVAGTHLYFVSDSYFQVIGSGIRYRPVKISLINDQIIENLAAIGIRLCGLF